MSPSHVPVAREDSTREAHDPLLFPTGRTTGQITFTFKPQFPRRQNERKRVAGSSLHPAIFLGHVLYGRLRPGLTALLGQREGDGHDEGGNDTDIY